MKKMELQIQELLSYSVVFPDRNDNIEDLLMSIPSNSAIEFISHKLAQKTYQFIGEHDLHIWSPWVLNCRRDVKNPIGHYAQQYNLSGYALIDKYSLLLLTSHLLTCYNGKSNELSTDDYSNLLLAYMICCDERLKHNKSLRYNTMTADAFTESFMPIVLKNDDVEVPRDYRLLLIKCYMLLIEFPKRSALFENYLDEFCVGKGLISAKYYLDELFLTFLNLSYPDITTCVMEIDKKCVSTCNYFDNISIDPAKYTHDDDFLMLREKPVLKTGPQRYNFMSKKYFLDKAYTGLLFDIKSTLVNRGILDAENGYGRLKSLIGEEFSEKLLFYTLMQRCFGQRYVNYSGDELKIILGDGMPDFYMRRGNRLFIFECKDSQVASTKKLSGNYEIIKQAIFDKYVVNAKGQPKGVRQLVQVIRDKLSVIIQNVDNSIPNGIKYVFPIIIYFDNCLDIEGPNYLLNKEFKKQLENIETESDFIIKDLVMINLEQIMRLEDYFSNDKLKLASLINSYIDYKSQAELNQVFPFNKFLFQQAQKKGYSMKKTKWFDEIYKQLVAMDNMV